MSGLINKVKDALHSDKSATHDTPHSHSATHGTHDNTHAHSATHATHGTTGTGANLAAQREGPAPTTAGPHHSDMLNKVDPRIDSDKDHSRNLGANPDRSATTGTHHTTGHHTTNTGHSTGLGHSTGYSTGNYSENVPEGTYGHHNSRLANAADPRVDSDVDGSRNLGSSTHNTGTHGTTGLHSSGAPEGTYGHHQSRLANSADPRIDSDADGSRNLGGSTYGHNTRSTGVGGIGGASATGPAPNTAGPHKSDALNKADPRVDSDLDGSKTYGGNKTFNQSGEPNYANRDPTDAAQVPPSVMQKHIGAPELAHDDYAHNRERRHSVQTHQEQYRGL